MLTYRPKKTVIHSLNPLCKFAWVGAIVILSLIFEDPVYLLLMFLSTLPIVFLADIKREYLKFMKFTVSLCFLIIFLNVLFSGEGKHVIYQTPFIFPLSGYLRITLEAILFGVGMSLRLINIVSSFTIFSLTLHPDDFMLVMLKLRFPYKSVLVASLSARFVPTLINDAKTIGDAFRSRGLEFDRGGFLRRIKSSVPLLVALLSNSLDRAVQVAEAMESKAFGSENKRTFYREIKMSRVDSLVLALCFLPLIFGVFVRLLGYGSFQYYPTFQALTLTSLENPLMLLFISTLFLMVTFTFLKRRVLFDQI